MLIDQTSTPKAASQASSTPSGSPCQTDEAEPAFPPNEADVQEWLSARAAAFEHAVPISDAYVHCSDRDQAAPPSQTIDMNLRSYQREMFERSLHRNVIVTVGP